MHDHQLLHLFDTLKHYCTFTLQKGVFAKFSFFPPHQYRLTEILSTPIVSLAIHNPLVGSLHIKYISIHSICTPTQPPPSRYDHSQDEQSIPLDKWKRKSQNNKVKLSILVAQNLSCLSFAGECIFYPLVTEKDH